MKQLVSDAEHYLHHSGGSSSSNNSNSGGDTDSQGGSSSCGGSTNTDSESIVSQPKSELSEISSVGPGGGPGKLRHSDSLLLLTQVNTQNNMWLQRVTVSKDVGAKGHN